MRIRRSLAVVAVACAALPAPAEAAERRCGDIAFADHSDNGVWDIRARGVGCGAARRVARAAEPHGVYDGPYAYRARGFRCRGTLDDTGLARVAWRCTRRGARVRFVRT